LEARNRIAATLRAAVCGSSPRLGGRAWLSQRVAKPCTRHQAAVPARGMLGPRRVAVTVPTPVACQNGRPDLWPGVSARLRRFAGTR
jgi:hypothetical protein